MKYLLKITFYLFLLMSISTSYNCSKDSNSPTGNLPVADFTFTPSSGYKLLMVEFTDKSTNAATYEWDFGNGQTSNLSNPTTIYSNDGVYTITLKVTNKDGTDKITKTVTVKNPPKSVKVKKVTITKFPETDENGDNWDSSLSGRYPDVYFVITNQTSVLYKDSTSDRKENLRKVDLPTSWESTNGFYEFTNLNEGFGISLYDFESFIDDQFMGGVYTSQTFSNRISDGNLPSEITLNYGEYTFTVGLEWVL